MIYMQKYPDAPDDAQLRSHFGLFCVNITSQKFIFTIHGKNGVFYYA